MLSHFLNCFKGIRPADLGHLKQQLRDCPCSPNCVSSLASDKLHYVEPLDSTITELNRVLQQLPRVEVILFDQNYLYAEFSSRFFGFVDDVEFLYDEANQQLQLRSASRLGYGDLGANRRRIEFLRNQLVN